MTPRARRVVVVLVLVAAAGAAVLMLGRAGFGWPDGGLPGYADDLADVIELYPLPDDEAGGQLADVIELYAARR